MTPTLQDDLAALLNRHSQENGSDTPDFLLAEHLLCCLAAWNMMIRKRDAWYGRPGLQAAINHGDPLSPLPEETL